jgi:hypothetical protein
MVVLAIVACRVSLAAAQDFDEGPGYGPQYADGPESAVDGPEGAEGPQCSPAFLREWYLWDDPEGKKIGGISGGISGVKAPMGRIGSKHTKAGSGGRCR